MLCPQPAGPCWLCPMTHSHGTLANRCFKCPLNLVTIQLCLKVGRTPNRAGTRKHHGRRRWVSMAQSGDHHGLTVGGCDWSTAGLDGRQAWGVGSEPRRALRKHSLGQESCNDSSGDHLQGRQCPGGGQKTLSDKNSTYSLGDTVHTVSEDQGCRANRWPRR